MNENSHHTGTVEKGNTDLSGGRLCQY
jgi:hypothetical protein